MGEDQRRSTRYKNNPNEKYFFAVGFCCIIGVLIYGLVSVFKELQEKGKREAELQTTIIKLRTALDKDFSSFRSDMSNKIVGLRADLEGSKRQRKDLYKKTETNEKNEKDVHKYVKHNDGDSKPLPCLMVLSSSRPSFRICTLDPTLSKVSKLIHTTGHLELMSHWPLHRLLQGVDDPLVVDVGSGLGYLAIQACSLGARVISVEENAQLANLIRTSVDLNEGKLKGTINIIHGITNIKPSYEKNEITIDGVVGVKDVHLLHVSSRGNGAVASLLGAHELISSKRVRYILLELCPQRSIKNFGEDPLALLKKLVSIGYNIFDDKTAEDGALTVSELSLLLHGIKGKACKHIFIARAV